MIRSRLPVAAAECSSGRTRKRPTTMMMAMTAIAWPNAKATAPSAPSVPPESTPTITRIGTTIRSWNSSTESEMRPTLLAARCCSASTCMTTAVEDSARHMPSTKPDGGGMPTARTSMPMAKVESTTWTSPTPNT